MVFKKEKVTPTFRNDTFMSFNHFIVIKLWYFWVSHWPKCFPKADFLYTPPSQFSPSFIFISIILQKRGQRSRGETVKTCWDLYLRRCSASSSNAAAAVLPLRGGKKRENTLFSVANQMNSWIKDMRGFQQPTRRPLDETFLCAAADSQPSLLVWAEGKKNASLTLAAFRFQTRATEPQMPQMLFPPCSLFILCSFYAFGQFIWNLSKLIKDFLYFFPLATSPNIKKKTFNWLHLVSLWKGDSKISKMNKNE